MRRSKCWLVFGFAALAASAIFAETVVVDLGNSGAPLRKIWTGANGSLPYAGFTDIKSEVGVHLPEDWMEDSYPFGNFLFGHCHIKPWAYELELEEIVEWTGTGYIYHFDQLVEYMENVLDSGVRPQVTMTGTPFHLYDQSTPLEDHDPKVDYPYCGNFGHIVEPPNSEGQFAFDWQDMVGALMARFAAEFGWDELERWKWATWTEPGIAGHFTGTNLEMRDLIRQTRNIFNWHQNERDRDLDFRLGNFVNANEPRYLAPLEDTIYGLQDDGVDIWAQMPGLGLSVYGEDTVDNADGLDVVRTVLDGARPRLINLPIHIDETGILNVPGSGGSRLPAYQGDPTLYGASWWLRMIEDFRDHPLKIYDVNVWHRNLYLSSSKFREIEDWVKLPAFGSLTLLELLENKPEIPMARCGRATDGCLDVLAVADGDGAMAIVYRFDTDYDATTTTTDTVCFAGTDDSRPYAVARLALAEGGNYAFRELLSTYGDQGLDVRNYCDGPDGCSELNAVFGAPAPDEVRALQRIDDVVLVDYDALTSVGGQVCTTLTVGAHDVQMLRLYPADLSASTDIALDFEHDLSASSGEVPTSARGVSFDRGMDLSSDGSYLDPSETPTSSWHRYLPDDPTPHGAGSEAHQGAYLEGSDQMVFASRTLDLDAGEIRLWVKPDWPFAGETPLTRRSLLSWAPAAWIDDFQLYVWKEEQLFVFFHVDGIRHRLSYSVTGWQPNEWHRVEVDISPTEVSLVVDGIERDTLAVTPGMLEPLAALEATWKIGGSNWDGVVDGVRIR